MTDIQQIRKKLASLTDLEWFDTICDILKKENNPTTHRLTDIIGTEKPNPNNEIRGSKFLDTYDKRFKGACINPSLSIDDPDHPIDYLGFWGDTFKITIGDISARFKDYKTQINTYDGGTQIFFYPVPKDFEFTAIDCWTNKNEDEIDNLADLQVGGVTFRFGDNLVQGRDGFGMRRK
ncbi:hypothetical protein OOZ15_19120 [Galbibacter sp. EGI 63066]|uniref:hypothetical protein n=1 Tax=Galbibacter sp. EGI 63066 TaxID=2993559 RepID=UPI00224989D2|nr:hypothetical protein [Galbibacter sp. EGI 63066]MCX2682069.1 hypothetical protein [Galbibacter sp. EGI 63066]